MRCAAHFLCCCYHLLHNGEGECCSFLARWCRRYAAHVTAVGVALYTTSRVNAGSFSAVGVGVILPIYCCWCRLSHNGQGKCCPFFGRWRRRHGANFTAVGTAFYTSSGENAARFSDVGVGAVLPISLLLVPHFTTSRVNAARFSAVGEGAMLPNSLLLVPLFTQRRG